MMRCFARYLFLLGMLFLPSYLIRGVFFGVSLNVLDVLEGFSILACFLVLLREKKVFLSITRESKGVLFAFLCIFLGSALSAFFSEGFSTQEWGIVKSWVVLPFLFVFLGGVCGFLRAGMFTYAVSAFGVALLSMELPLNEGITYDGRLRGWYESPNQLAIYLVPAIVFWYFLARFFWLKGNKNKALFVFGAILFSGIALFETKSFGGIMAVFLGICFGEIAFFVRERRKITKRILVLTGGLLLVTSLVLIPIFQGKIGERSSWSSRVMIWKSALFIGREYSIFGIGPGNFQEKYLEYQRFFPPYLEWAVPHPHNVFLAFWLYSGLLGLCGFLIIIFSLGKNFWKNKKNLTNFQIMTFAVTISIFALGFSDTIFWGNSLSVLFFSFIFRGCTLSLKYEDVCYDHPSIE